MNRLVIERQLRDIFDYRQRRIEELLLRGAVRPRRKHLAGMAAGVRHLPSTRVPGYRERGLGVHALDRDRPTSSG